MTKDQKEVISKALGKIIAAFLMWYTIGGLLSGKMLPRDWPEWVRIVATAMFILYMGLAGESKK